MILSCIKTRQMLTFIHLIVKTKVSVPAEDTHTHPPPHTHTCQMQTTQKMQTFDEEKIKVQIFTVILEFCKKMPLSQVYMPFYDKPSLLENSGIFDKAPWIFGK